MPITTRPPRPEHWGESVGGYIWHHIIPFSVLRDVWNHLEREFITVENPEPRVALLRYLALCDPHFPAAEALVDRIRERRRASHSPLVRLEVHESLALHTAISWPTWNIVEGPRLRTDDPGDEYLDRFTAGLNTEEYVRMRAMDTLYGRLAAFAGLPAPLPPGALAAISSYLLQCKRFIYADAPIRHRPEMWVEEDPVLHLWRKARDAGKPHQG